MSKNKGITEQDIRTALLTANGNKTKAAQILDVNVRTLQRRLEKMPDVVVPEGHKVKGVSSLIDAQTGEVKMQWIKSAEAAEEREELCREALEALKSEVPRVPRIPKPRAALREDLMNLYVVTDYHLGMLAWDEEAGANWDMKIAEKLLLNWMGAAIKTAPKASHAVLAQLGDFLHYDSFESVTPTSKHVLDADSRPQKMVRVALRVLRQLIEMLLRTHDTVYVLMAEGNHDIMASAWLREAFALMYKDEPRVTVETRPDPYYAHEWGQTVLFFHHGHLRKVPNVSEVLVRKFREEYGRCTKAYAHMGHLHHRDAKEKALMEVEQHPTLAAADAYASRGGWLSERVAKVLTYSKKYGEVGRIGITPEMLEG